jgi:lysine-specific demethylase 8
VDITQLSSMPPDVRERFAGARGWFARLEPGDCLYVPRGTWHAVVSSSPSISLSIFGALPAGCADRSLG